MGVCGRKKTRTKHSREIRPNPFESFSMERGVALDAGPSFKDAFDDSEV
jgi:hypothetical protein